MSYLPRPPDQVDLGLSGRLNSPSSIPVPSPSAGQGEGEEVVSCRRGLFGGDFTLVECCLPTRSTSRWRAGS